MASSVEFRSMQPVTSKNFGFIIAYLAPGFILLIGIGFHSTTVDTWLTGNDGTAMITVGGFLFSTLAAVIAGLLCSTLRWLVLDTIHHWTGLRRPDWNYRKLQENLGAYALLEENHYRYYQFYGNGLIAWTISYVSWRVGDKWAYLIHWSDALFLAISLLLFFGSRDTLRKYYCRVEALLGQ